MGAPAGEIEVVVLSGDDHPGTVAPPVRAVRRPAVVVVLLVAVLLVLGGPVAVERPVGEVAGPAPRSGEGGGCPGLETRRLWCSFLADDRCCPTGAGGGGSPAGVRVDGS